MSEKLDKLRATLKKEQERRIKLNNRIAVLERRIQEEEAAEVSSMVRTANVTPEHRSGTSNFQQLKSYHSCFVSLSGGAPLRKGLYPILSIYLSQSRLSP